MKLVYGVGINNADYNISQKVNGKAVLCQYYTKWRSMLQRCYDEKHHLKHPSYIGCSVDHSWHYFMTFRDWMVKQDWKDKALDKDILFTGNRVYAPDTCCFVTRDVNSFIARGIKDKGSTSWKSSSRHRSQISVNGVSTPLGFYDTPEEAKQVWYSAKRELAIKLAEKQTDIRMAEALLAMFPC